MKKFILLILAVMLLLSFTACGGNEPQPSSSQQGNEPSSSQQENEPNSSGENNENAALFIGKWTDGNTTLTIKEDGSCNQFIKEGYVKGELKNDISIDLKWEIDANNNLITIDETEGGYNTWVRTDENGTVKLKREGSNEVLALE